MKSVLDYIRKNAFLTISLLGVTLIPLIYGGLYLWAFWDPYTGMKNAKIAVVNLDIGATKDDEKYHFGQDIIDKLKDDHNLGWKFVTSSDAQEGMDNLKYYATLTIPSSFSEDVISVDSDKVTQAQLDIKIRDTNSYFASKYIKSAVTEVAKKLKIEVQKKYFDNLFVNIRDIGDKLKDGSDGAWKLTDGLSDANDGSKTLFDGMVKVKDGIFSVKDGIIKLFDGSKTLRDGVKTAYDGSNTLLNGVNQVSAGSHNIATASATISSAVGQLSAGSNQLASSSALILVGSTTLRDSISVLNGQYEIFDTGVNQLQTGYSQIPLGIQKILSDLNDYASENSNASSSAKFSEALSITNSLNTVAPQIESSLSTLATSSAQIRAGISQISAGNNNFVTQYTTFNSGVLQLQGGLDLLYTNTQSMASGAAQIDSGLGTVLTGTISLRDGIAKLVDGSNSLSDNLGTAVDGSRKVSDGMSDAADGANKLNDGIVDAHDGSKELADKITDAQNKIAEKSNPDKNEIQATVMSDPVDVKETHISEVPNNGTAFAPYFIPLSLWVGAMSIFFVLKIPAKRKYKNFKKLFLSLKTYGISLLVGVIQALLLPYVMTKGLKLKAIDYHRLYIYCIFLSVLFVSIQYFLLRILANVGRFVGIILLMMQLTSSSGTYPVETSSQFFQSISTYLPMTYAVRMLREIISGGNWSTSFSSWQTTIYMMIISILLCIVQSYAFPRTKKLLSDLSII